MSQDKREWDTAAIRKFKAAFKQYDDSWNPFGAAKKSRDLLDAAKDMLDQRRVAAATALGALNSGPPGKGRKMTLELVEVMLVLNNRTQAALETADELPEDAKSAAVDAQRKVLSGLADEWVAFDARCVSAHNMMLAEPEDDKLREKLLARKDSLLSYAATLEAYGADGGAKKFLQALKLDTIGLADLAHELDRVQQVLSANTMKAPVAPKDAAKVYGAAMQKLYGVAVNAGAGVDGAKLPYRELLAAFSLIPPEQARNSKLTDVQIAKLDFTGGDFSRTNKRIRISPELSLDSTSDYINPETGKAEKVNSFSITTLHEIGHSVDAAYGLMDKHQGKEGCGGWEEYDPSAYLASGFGTAKGALATSMQDFFNQKVIPGDQITVTEDELKEAYFDYATGTAADKAFGKLLTVRIDGAGQQELTLDVSPILSELIEAVSTACKDKKRGADVDAIWSGIESSVAAGVGNLDKLIAGAITTGAFETKFRALFDKDGKVANDPVVPAPLIFWISDQSMAGMDEKLKAARTAAATWIGTNGPVLAPALDLTKYLAEASPWNQDLSKAKIGELPASHQAYKGNTKWWRYSSSARSATQVTNYQWRAPAEWFAELYAISWFKKVEPPRAVAAELRPYFFGGSVPL